MQEENTLTGDVSLPDDFAAFEAVREGRTPAVETEVEAPSEDSEESRSADESETPEDQEPEAEKKEDEKPGKRGIEKRFRDLTSEIRDLKQRLAAKDEGVASPTKVESKPAAEGKPDVNSFEGTYEEYLEALADWKIDQKLAAKVAADQRAKAQEQAKVVEAKWTERQDAARGVHKDYDDVVSSVDDIVFHDAIGEALIDSEYGAEIAYIIAADRKEAERIAKLSPIAAVRAIGAIEAKLEAAKAPKPKTAKVSKAPEPITPVSRPSQAGVKKPLGEVTSFEEYERRRQAGER